MKDGGWSFQFSVFGFRFSVFSGLSQRRQGAEEPIANGRVEAELRTEAELRAKANTND
jgi:hypothetical protein